MTITLPTNLRRRHRTLRAAAAFGLSTDRPAHDHAARTARLAAAARELLTSLPSGGIGLITGPSGSGKSTLLKSLRGITVNPARLHDEPRPIAELSRLPLPRWLKLLSAFGLAEAQLLLTPARHLSAGQQFRLALALAASRTSSLFLCDEFCSLLDRPTALSIASSIRRWVTRNPNTRFIAATAHDDLTEALQPDAILSLDEDTITLATRT